MDLATALRIAVTQTKADTEELRRQGMGNPPNHPPRDLVISEFMSILSMKSHGSDKVSALEVPPHYLPCTRPAEELEPLMVSRMRLEDHHRTYQVLVHVLTPPLRSSMLKFIVEDEEGTAVKLQLHHQLKDNKEINGSILSPGHVCIVKDPYFSLSATGYVLQVYHVSDMIRLQDTDSRIPLKWRKEVDGSSGDIRLRGNAAVHKKNWAEAENLYTNAIWAAKTPNEKELACLNRSLANLRLDRPVKALDDALSGHPSEDIPGLTAQSEKALFRMAKAFYSLGWFKPCLERLLAVVRLNPDIADAHDEIRRVNQRLREEENGAYDFANMYKQAEATPPLIDCATYVGPVAVRDSPGQGKGLFTTRPVKAGELLLCEKAFAYVYAGKDVPHDQISTTIMVNRDADILCEGGQANLTAEAVQKLYHEHAGSKAFTHLYHGDYIPDTASVALSEVDGAPVVDSYVDPFLIPPFLNIPIPGITISTKPSGQLTSLRRRFLATQIISLNCFAAPRTSLEPNASPVCGGCNNDSGDARDGTCGVWLLASRINHACVANCWRSFIGDMLLVRSGADLDAGAELLFRYRQPAAHETLAETRAGLASWGFACHCALCTDREKTPPERVARRKALHARFGRFLEPTPERPFSTPSVFATEVWLARLLRDLEKTYEDSADAAAVPRVELCQLCFELAKMRLARDDSVGALERLVQALETLGFVITARPPRLGPDEEDEGKERLEIRRWGHVNALTVEVFLRMFNAYQTLAPELCEVIRGYARTAYSIVVGEAETIGRRFPVFA
ncbi:hypothetical protein GGR52DRAFT_195650 [Hypoxylon sp. FL1284]|nr:hypothetical protein GGR52DRAFT_195650 [Hypoxylon sp. FL1284]